MRILFDIIAKFNVKHDVGNEVRVYEHAYVCCRYPAVCMHGDKSQQERDYVLRGMHLSSFLVQFCRGPYVRLGSDFGLVILSSFLYFVGVHRCRWQWELTVLQLA
jgi:hypothetical protein